MGSLQEAPAFELSGPALRVFQRAVACLAKMGRDAAVILRSEELVLHGADDSHSAAMQFAFRSRFFRATPASTSMPGAAPMRESNVVVGARQLLVALKGAQQRTGQAESLTVGLSRPVAPNHRGARGIGDQQQRLVLEFTARFGGKVRHRVPLLESMPFLPGEPNAGPHSAALSPSLLARVLDHCSPMARGGGGCEEVTLSAVRGEGLRVQSHDLVAGGGGGAGQGHRTEVLIQRSDLEACSLDGKGGEVVFSGRGLRDFARAADACAKDLEVLGIADGSALLELRFGAEGGSVACRMAAVADGRVHTLQDFSAVLIVATRSTDENGAEGGNTTQGTLQGTVQATQGARRPQPRQGSTKRRAVAAPPPAAAEIFDAFPDHSGQIPKTQASTAATQSRLRAPVTETQPTQPAQPVLPAPQLPPQLPPQMPPQFAARPAPAAAPAVHAAPPPPAVPTQPTWPAAPAPQPQAAAPQVDSLPPTAPAPMPQVHLAATQPGLGFQAPQPAAAPAAPAAAAGAWWQGGQAPPQEVLAGRVQAGSQMLASQLANALQVPDSDDELIGADPDEVAFAHGIQEESVDWFDVDKLW